MHINILSVGRLKEQYLQQAQLEYLKRLQAYAKVSVVEVPDEIVREVLSPAMEEIIMMKEARHLAKYIRPDTSHIIVLDREGSQMTSVEFSEYIADLGLQGKSRISFVIGGTLGLGATVLELAHQRLSFSKMTFPHQLMRVILLEQIFRAFKIARGEPYHK